MIGGTLLNAVRVKGTLIKGLNGATKKLLK